MLIHFGIAFTIYVYEPAAKLILHGTLLYFIILILQRKNKNNEALMAAGYMAGAEVFYRMTDGLIFYETGKYTVILFLLIGLLFKGTSFKSISFWIYLIILVPGILVASITAPYQMDFRNAISFNLSGPLCLGITAVYCYYKKIKKSDFEKVIVMMLMPLIANMFYLFVYTPRLGDILINMSANYASSGGYGPNQISTVMGMGAFLLITRLFIIHNKTINLIDLGLLAMMSYRAIVTFSRGGVITGIFCAIAFLVILYYKQPNKGRKILAFKLSVLTGSLFFIWMYISILTGGLIVNRYQGEDASGKLKDDITTGRAELIITELQGFYYNPLMGVGVGQAMMFRKEETGVVTASHNEISRLMSEHGMLGVVAILILVFIPVFFWLKFRNNYYFLGFMVFWFMTINHSAMRIALPAFVYGLALLYIVDDTKKPNSQKPQPKAINPAQAQLQL